jgi:hypothetical protein
MIEEFIDQRDVQKRGNLYVKYPMAYVVLKMLTKYGIVNVLDITYGRGRFYVMYRPRVLIGVDPIKWEWLVKPDVFYQMNAYHFYRLLRSSELSIGKNIDCVVIDPPKWKDATYRRRDEYNFIIGKPIDIIQCGRKIAELIKAPYLFLHFNQQLQLGEPLHVVRFRWFARYQNTQDKNTSLYILYKL